MALQIDGIEIATDEEGYLINPDDWNETVTEQMALAENVELMDETWVVVKFIRAFYDEHKVAVDIRFVAKHLASECGYTKKEARNRLFKLFPYGYVKQACKIAGMKRPRGWSTG